MDRDGVRQGALTLVIRENPPFNSSNHYRFRIGVEPGCAGAVQDVVGTTTPLTDGSWYHVVGVLDGAQVILYVNGLAETTVAWPHGLCPGTAGTSFWVGEDALGQSAEGDIDECVVWPTALTATQVCDLCRYGANGAHADRGSTQCSSCTP